MPLYEHVFLARQDASTQQVEELTNQITGVITGMGGKITKTENWGVRSLTYRMNKNRKAHFVLLNIDGPPRWSTRSSARNVSTKTSSAISPSASKNMKKVRLR